MAATFLFISYALANFLSPVLLRLTLVWVEATRMQGQRMCSSTLSTDVQLTGQRRGMTCLVCSSLFTFQLCLYIFISLMSLPRIVRVFAHSVFSLYLGCFFQRSLVMLGWGEHCLHGYARGVCFTTPFLCEQLTNSYLRIQKVKL